MPSIAIIGSGPTAIYTLKYLLALSQPLAITVFESQKEAGKGTPYHQDWNDKQMLSNIASIELPPVTETLVEWLQALPEHDLAMMGLTPEEIDERTFYPRVVLGEYFKTQLRKLTRHVEKKNGSLAVKTTHKVVDVVIENEGITLVVQPQSISEPLRERFDYVVMATGHVWPTETEIRPGYFLSPWPAAALRTIKNGTVGIRGTSLSGIDAAVALSVARGSFKRDAAGVLEYLPEPGTEAFKMTMLSRKGLLPEADFYYPLPYEPLQICTLNAIHALIANRPRSVLLDAVFALFKQELAAADPSYSQKLNLHALTLEAFSHAYFAEREAQDTFVWAEQNLAEAKKNQAKHITVGWRYAILRMHEVIKCIVPKLLAEDHKRFCHYFKPIFVDDYATVPHESIERLIALHRAKKLDVLRAGDDYTLDTETVERGAHLMIGDTAYDFDAFIEAMGQRALSVHDFPFPSLWKQGIVHNATAPHFVYTPLGQRVKKNVDIGGIDLDEAFHPVSDSPFTNQLYCLSLPFMLSQFPFSQGITSSHEMGQAVAGDMAMQLAREAGENAPLSQAS